MKEVKSIQEFEKLIKDDLFIFIGKNNTCVMCNPAKERLEKLLDSRGIEGYYGDIEELPLVRGMYTIFSAPTILIFSQKKEILRESGFINFDNITRLLDIKK